MSYDHILQSSGTPCQNEGENVASSNPCEDCWCYQGEVSCYELMCDYLPVFCVDPVPLEGVCCVDFECPNGNICSILLWVFTVLNTSTNKVVCPQIPCHWCWGGSWGLQINMRKQNGF